MEIAPVPQRSTPRARRRLGLALLVLAPVVALVLLPAGLGLDRYLVTDGSMSGTMGRGSLVIARDVPPGDLRVGDVVSFRPPGHDRVTHRIVGIDHDVAITRGDRLPTADPWRLTLDDPTYARVLVTVPWVGYPLVSEARDVVACLAAAALLLVLLVTTRPRVRSTRGAGAEPSASLSSRAKVGVG